MAPNGTAPRLERRFLAKRVFDVIAGNRILRRARRVLAVSGAEERQLETLGVAKSRVRRVPNPVDLEEFAVPPVRGRFRQRIGCGNRPLILYLGKLTPRKRVDDLVRAIPLLASSPCLVIAGNDMGGGARIRRTVTSLSLDRRTVFTGLLRGRERLEALADADVVVYPAEHEIFGLVPLEALLAGTPVVVSGDCGCGEIIASVGGGAVVPVGDVTAIARAIDDVLARPAAWREAAGRAAERIRQCYGPDAVSDTLSSVYDELAAAR